MSACRSLAAAAAVLTASAALADDVDWPSLPCTPISAYQAVNADGSSAYTGGFPVKMIGVALNNIEDWLDPTPNNFFAPFSFRIGG